MKLSTIFFIVGSIVLLKSANCNPVYFDGLIAKNRTLQECMSGGSTSKSDMYITTPDMIRKLGYPAEEHVVVTEDGYILAIHRIPGKPGSQPVFLQHGLVFSSFDWIVTGKNKALGLILADQGYDVWMGNIRGSTYSRCHTNYKISQFEYWNFSWHEMGLYDLPAQISYVTNKTNQKIIYVGHSMGTTMFFVMANERPEIISNIKVMFSLAPIAYLGDSKSLLKIFTPFPKEIELFSVLKGSGEFLSSTPLLKNLLKYVCTLTSIQKRLCVDFLFTIIGFDSPQFNYTLLPLILYHMPAGTSLKVLNHYNQVQSNGKFQQYDYGPENNLIIYNSEEPPQYDISKVKVPVGLFSAENDLFARPMGVKRLIDELPNKILDYKVSLPQFNHLDFMYAIDAPKYVYEKLLSVMKDYN